MDEHVRAFPLLPDVVGEPAAAPLLDLRHGAPVFDDRFRKRAEDGLGGVRTQIRVDDEQTFVIDHLSSIVTVHGSLEAGIRPVEDPFGGPFDRAFDDGDFVRFERVEHEFCQIMDL